MQNAVDELLRYLIVPGKSSPDSLASTFPVSPSSSIEGSLSSEEQYWRARGQARDDHSYSNKSVDIEMTQEMEVDTPAAVPAPLDATNMPGQIFSIEEFMALRGNSGATGTLGSDVGAQRAPQPRAVSARSSKHTIELHEKYQALGIQPPDLVFSGGSIEGWTVSTDFLGRNLSVDGPCGSKQEAKERLSELCLEVIRELEREGKLERVPKAKKRKTEGGEPEVIKKEENQPVINYIGQLLEFQRSIAAPQPTYTDYQLSQSFSCEVTIDGQPTPFGSRTTFFTSKKAARQHAAGCAVAHFKAQGTWPEDHAQNGGGIRKVKSPLSSDPNSRTPTPLASSDTPTPGSPSSSSYAQRVTNLATQLGLSTPEWRFTPSSATAPGFHTVTCIFKNGGPHEGPLGEVRHVFGKKRAKEECARLVLGYLEDVRETRLEVARGVIARAGLRETDGERVLKKGMRDVGVLEAEESTGDEAFESATEDV